MDALPSTTHDILNIFIPYQHLQLNSAFLLDFKLHPVSQQTHVISCRITSSFFSGESRTWTQLNPVSVNSVE